VSLNTLEYLAGYLNDTLRSPSVYAIERRHWHIRASKSNLWAELVRGLCTIDINAQT